MPVSLWGIRGFPFTFPAKKNVLESFMATHLMPKSPNKQIKILKCLAGRATGQCHMCGTGKWEVVKAEAAHVSEIVDCPFLIGKHLYVVRVDWSSPWTMSPLRPQTVSWTLWDLPEYLIKIVLLDHFPLDTNRHLANIFLSIRPHKYISKWDPKTWQCCPIMYIKDESTELN